ncbi:11732_t:CDS:2 [Funneliformis mosseae]|uniref:11732_t:CDS:1 n=1 Tax=Funneliformis mosseae TaxID=27381 RepID=A0A9N8WKM9_FUNMO|nr:11732_t:CDS:2 [Funneliformis mosseae]
MAIGKWSRNTSNRANTWKALLDLEQKRITRPQGSQLIKVIQGV